MNWALMMSLRLSLNLQGQNRINNGSSTWELVPGVGGNVRANLPRKSSWSMSLSNNSNWISWPGSCVKITWKTDFKWSRRYARLPIPFVLSFPEKFTRVESLFLQRPDREIHHTAWQQSAEAQCQQNELVVAWNGSKMDDAAKRPQILKRICLSLQSSSIYKISRVARLMSPIHNVTTCEILPQSLLSLPLSCVEMRPTAHIVAAKLAYDFWGKKCHHFIISSTFFNLFSVRTNFGSYNLDSFTTFCFSTAHGFIELWGW